MINDGTTLRLFQWERVQMESWKIIAWLEATQSNEIINFSYTFYDINIVYDLLETTKTAHLSTCNCDLLPESCSYWSLQKFLKACN